eukprot:jgi/Ulvmu1/8533/UM044_0067.1
MSLFTCFSPFSQRRRRDAATPHERRASAAASALKAPPAPLTPSPSRMALSPPPPPHLLGPVRRSRTTDTGGESGRSSQPAHQPPPPALGHRRALTPFHLTDSPATTSTPPPHLPTPRLSASSCGDRDLPCTAPLPSPDHTRLLPTFPPATACRPGNPRCPPPPARPRRLCRQHGHLHGAHSPSLPLHALHHDDSSKTAAANQPLPPPTPAPSPLPSGRILPQQAAASRTCRAFARILSLRVPTHHASFQSGSRLAARAPPAAARLGPIRALSLAAETNLSSDFSVHLYVTARSARSAAILAACSAAAGKRAAARSRSAQGVDYCGVLPTTVEEEIEDTASIPLDATAMPPCASPTTRPPSRSTPPTPQNHFRSRMSSHSPSMTQHSSSLADVSADVLVDMCGPDAGTEMNRDFANAALAGEDVMSTVGTSCDEGRCGPQQLGVCSFPGTIMSSLHSTASGSLLGLIAARMPQPPARMPPPLPNCPTQRGARRCGGPAAEDEGAAVSSGEVREDRCGGAIADSAGIRSRRRASRRIPAWTLHRR